MWWWSHRNKQVTLKYLFIFRARDLLKSYQLVIQILAPIKQIVYWLAKEKYQESNENRPDFAMSIEKVYAERKSIYFDCANYEFPWISDKDYCNIKEIVKIWLHRLGNKNLPNITERYYFPSLQILHELKLNKVIVSCGKDGLLIPLKEFVQHVGEISVETRISISQFIAECRRKSPLPVLLYISKTPSLSEVQVIDQFCRLSVEYVVFEKSIEIPSQILKYNLTTYILNLEAKFSQYVPAFDEQLPKRYFLFGNPITSSPSPTLHNKSFEIIDGTSCPIDDKSDVPSEVFIALVDKTLASLDITSFTKQNLFKRRYYLCQSVDERILKHFVSHPRFAGGSVTIPFKETVLPLIQDSSISVKRIQAVNTLKKTKTLFGDNTDWLGIYQVLQSKLSNVTGKIALIIGAGGTSYAAAFCLKIELKMDVYIYNRTVEKAQSVANRFNLKVCNALQDLSDVCVIVSTIPASANFKVPDNIFKETPVVLDAAYKPKHTTLLKQAAEFKCKLCFGVEMLIEQGIEQQRVWNSRSDDQSELDSRITEVRAAVMSFYDS